MPDQTSTPTLAVDSIVDFIKTQLALDEQIARLAGETRGGAIASWHVDCDCPNKDAGVHADDCYACRVEGDNITIYDEGGHDEYQARHIARHDPATVLAKVEANRYLLEWCAEVTQHFDWSTLNQPGSLKHDPNARATHTAVVALLSMAAPYARRPGFKPEWRLP